MERALVFLLLLAACGGGVASIETTTSPTIATTLQPTTTAAVTTEAPTTTEAATTTAAAADAAPPELAGRWEKENALGDRVFLSLTGTNYAFVVVGQGQASAGSISVEGNQIRFYAGNTAPGEGSYEWTVDGDTLTFVELDPPDEHGGRRAGLLEVPWTRLG